MLFTAQPDRVQAATCAFPWSCGVLISAIPLGDAILLTREHIPRLWVHDNIFPISYFSALPAI